MVVSTGTWGFCLSFVRYTAVGGIATAVHYALLGLLVEAAREPPAAATALGALVGAVVAYAGNRHFTFGGLGRDHRRAMRRFLLVAALSAALNALLVALGTAAGLLLGYGLNKRWSFAL